METYLIWEQKTEFSPVVRRAFILSVSFDCAIRKARKAGIRVVDCWKCNVSRRTLETLWRKKSHMVTF